MPTQQFIQLIITKVQLNLKAEAAKSYLSYLWWVLEPAMFVGIFYLVFGVFLSRGGPDFVVFLVCGKIPFLWFSRSVTNSSNAIGSGRGLMNQIAIPKVFFPLVVILQDLVKSSVVFALMLLFIIFMGISPSVSWFALPVLMLLQLAFILPVALFAAMVVPFVPDLRYIINTGIMMMMFASGIFYSYKDVILPAHQDLFLLNPMANLIRSYREILIDGIWPDWGSLFPIFAVSFLSAMLIVLMLKRFDGLYPRLVLQ